MCGSLTGRPAARLSQSPAGLPGSASCAGSCSSDAAAAGGSALDPEGEHLAALRRLTDFRGAHVCEVGSGDGRLTTAIAVEAATVFAFDPDAEAIARARARLPRRLRSAVTYTAGDALDVDLPGHAFDVVFFSWSLCCMEPADVTPALHRFRDALVPGGLVLDLQVIPPAAVVEAGGAVVCTLEDETLLRRAASAAAIVDRFVTNGLLHEEAVDDHTVARHFPDGAALARHVETGDRLIPARALQTVEAIAGPCLIREACRLRRLRVPTTGTTETTDATWH